MSDSIDFSLVAKSLANDLILNGGLNPIVIFKHNVLSIYVNGQIIYNIYLMSY